MISLMLWIIYENFMLISRYQKLLQAYTG